MTPDIAVDIIVEALQLVMLLVMVLVVPGLVIGVIVALVQAATQINEQTLSFLPRLLVTLLALIVTGHWMTGKLMDYCVSCSSARPRWSADAGSRQLAAAADRRLWWPFCRIMALLSTAPVIGEATCRCRCARCCRWCWPS
jgi:flagellar biosynthetic protein FliQ